MINRILSACLVLLLASAALAQDPASPPPVTLKADGPPSDVLAEFSKTTGVPISVWPENLWEQRRGQANQFPSSISVDIQNQPFWVALETICQEIKLRPANMGQGEAITLQYQGDGPPLGRGPQCVTTYATVVAYHLQRNHTISLDSENPQPSRSCGMNINVYLDPRLRPIRYQQRPTIEQAVDENGNDIATHDPSSNSSDNDMNLRWMIQGQFIGLDYDPEKSKTLAKLNGSVVVQCAVETEKFEVEDLSSAKGTEKSVAGRKITLTSLKQEPKRVEIQLTIEPDGASKEEFRKTASQIFQAVKFMNSQGKALTSVGGGGGGGDQKLQYTLNASWNKDEEKPVKILWEIPTRIEPVEIPFEFKDLPLP